MLVHADARILYIVLQCPQPDSLLVKLSRDFPDRYGVQLFCLGTRTMEPVSQSTSLRPNLKLISPPT